MPTSLLVSSRIPLVPPSPGTVGPPLGGGGPLVSLALFMPLQEQTQWCWAAVSVGVNDFYGAGGAFGQCDVVNAEFGRGDCCFAGGSGACNQPWRLDLALGRVNRFDRFQGGTLDSNEIESEIDGGRPIGTRIGWFTGGGHFMVIDGFQHGDDGFHVQIKDPIFGTSDLTLVDFASNYQGSGSWTHTYVTTP